jgi:hypothetical protein
MKLRFAHLCSLNFLALSMVLAGCAAPTASPTLPPIQSGATPTLPPTPRPTHPFPTGTPVPVTSAENVVIETEPGPLYVILSTVDEHGLPGPSTIDLASEPAPDGAAPAGSVPTGSFAQVLEIRRLPPDYLRAFYRVQARDAAGETLEGWVADWYARRTAFVVVFDARGCACPFPVPLWADEQLAQSAGALANRSPLRLLALAEKAVQVQVLSDGAIGWLSRDIVHESQEHEFLHSIAP